MIQNQYYGQDTQGTEDCSPVCTTAKPLKYVSSTANKENVSLNCSTLTFNNSEKPKQKMNKSVVKEEDFSKIAQHYVLEGDRLRKKSIKYRNEKDPIPAKEQVSELSRNEEDGKIDKKELIKLEFLQKSGVLRPDQQKKLQAYRMKDNISIDSFKVKKNWPQQNDKSKAQFRMAVPVRSYNQPLAKPPQRESMQFRQRRYFQEDPNIRDEENGYVSGMDSMHLEDEELYDNGFYRSPSTQNVNRSMGIDRRPRNYY